MASNTIPSLYKALQVIQELTKSNCSQAELSKNLKITMSTAYRILSTLRAEGWVLKRSDARYMLGGGMLPLLSFFHRDISHLPGIQKIVAQIPEKTGLFGKLSVRSGLRHVELYRADPENERMRIKSRTGESFSITDGPTGIALLSNEPPENIAQIYENTHKESLLPDDLTHFQEAVKVCKENGYALQKVGSSRWEVMAMAVPVFRGKRIVAALAGFGAADDFKGQKAQKHADALKKIAKTCEKMLGPTAN